MRSVILVIPLPPGPGDVVIGVLTVVAGALIGTVALFLGRRSRNWLHYVTAVGGLAIVAGVVGQRPVGGGGGSPWDAGISLPLLGLHLNAVTAAGVLVALAGLTLTLLFERVPEDGERPRPLLHRALEDEDAV